LRIEPVRPIDEASCRIAVLDHGWRGVALFEDPDQPFMDALKRAHVTVRCQTGNFERRLLWS
jgi:hypothetical protein